MGVTGWEMLVYKIATRRLMSAHIAARIHERRAAVAKCSPVPTIRTTRIRVPIVSLFRGGIESAPTIHSAFPYYGNTSTDIRYLGGLWVDFDLPIPEVYSEFTLLLGSDFLITEEHDGALSDKKGQFVLLLVSKVLKLQANNLGLYMGERSQSGQTLVDDD